MKINIYKTLVEYINIVLTSDDKINSYVPNTHIAETFKEILVHLELYILFSSKYKDYDINLIGDINNIFKNTSEENKIHDIYQNYRKSLEQTFKTVNYHLDDYIMPYRSFYRKEMILFTQKYLKISD